MKLLGALFIVFSFSIFSRASEGCSEEGLMDSFNRGKNDFKQYYKTFGCNKLEGIEGSSWRKVYSKLEKKRKENDDKGNNNERKRCELPQGEELKSLVDERIPSLKQALEDAKEDLLDAEAELRRAQSNTAKNTNLQPIINHHAEAKVRFQEKQEIYTRNYNIQNNRLVMESDRCSGAMLTIKQADALIIGSEITAKLNVYNEGETLKDTIKTHEEAKSSSIDIQEEALKSSKKLAGHKQVFSSTNALIFASAVNSLSKDLEVWDSRSNFSRHERNIAEQKLAEYKQKALEAGLDIITQEGIKSNIDSDIKNLELISDNGPDWNTCQQNPNAPGCNTNPDNNNPDGPPVVADRDTKFPTGSSPLGRTSGGNTDGGDFGDDDAVDTVDDSSEEDEGSPEDPNALAVGKSTPSQGGVVIAGGAGGGGIGGSGAGGGAGKAKKQAGAPKRSGMRSSKVGNTYRRSKGRARRLASLKRNKKRGKFNPLAGLGKKQGGLSIKNSKALRRALAQEGVKKSKSFSLFRRITRAHRVSYKKKKILVYNHSKL